MAVLNYDIDQQFLWAQLDDGSTIPIYTLLNINNVEVKITEEGYLQIYNPHTNKFETIGNTSLIGPAGKMPKIEIGDVTTVDSDAGASLSVSDNGETYRLNLVLPRGQQGPQGEKGADGNPGRQGIQGPSGKQGEKGETGEQGETGANGETYYTWIKYASNSYGSDMSNDPSDTSSYIGIAYNKTTKNASEDAKDYKWFRFKGEDGDTYYTWIKYADKEPVTADDIYDVPKSTTEYIGIATNQTQQTESDDPNQYTWSKFKGDKGDPGEPGADGKNGDPGKDMTYITQFPENPKYGQKVFWNGPTIATTSVPNGYAELGEVYEYCPESTIPSDVYKLKIYIQYSTNPNFTDWDYFEDSSLLAYNFMQLVQRRPRGYWSADQQYIKLDCSKDLSTETHLKAIVDILAEADLHKDDQEESGWRKLYETKQQLVNSPDNTSKMLYWKYYTVTTDLNEDANYWVPISALGRIEDSSIA